MYEQLRFTSAFISPFAGRGTFLCSALGLFSALAARVHFLCLPKENEPKERAPRWRRPFGVPCAPRPFARSPNSALRASDTRLAFPQKSCGARQRQRGAKSKPHITTPVGTATGLLQKPNLPPNSRRLRRESQEQSGKARRMSERLRCLQSRVRRAPIAPRSAGQSR